MGVEISFTEVDWNQLLKLVGDKAPVSDWLDEDDEDELAFSVGGSFGYSSFHQNGNFNDLYEAMRGELPDDQREMSDRFYALLSWWEPETANITRAPRGMQIQNFDLDWECDVPYMLEQVQGIFSPESVKKALMYGKEIDFDNIKQLIDSIYPAPAIWQTNESKSSLAAKNWKHQESLENFHRYNCFYRAEDAYEHATIWFNALSKASENNNGFLFWSS